MAKDEAWEAFKFTIYSDQPFTAIEEAADAYAQAHTDAALADTLGMLEELAKLQDSVVIYLHDGQTALEVWQHKGPGMEFRYQKQGRITPCHEENISRAEAEALLKGKVNDKDDKTA